MHDIQERLLALIEKKNIGDLTLREMGERIHEPDQPQKIKHHLLQLAKRGLIKIDRRKKIITSLKSNPVAHTKFFSIPILGAANCGEATQFADEYVEGYLTVSKKLLSSKSTKLFAIRAVGNSMNRASIGLAKSCIEDSDYVIVDGEANNPKNGEYVLSTIDDVANIKKFILDKQAKQIALVSESSQHIPPIYIHPDDTRYVVSGRIIQVIKQPK